MNPSKLERLLEELLKLKNEILLQRDEEQTHLWQNNLSDYVNLRNFNLTAIQEELTSIGLSSLGRSQTCVMSSIHQNIKILEQLLGKPSSLDEHDYLDFKSAKKILKHNAKIFGTSDGEHYKTKVMVTLPSEAAQSNELIKDLIAQDVSVLRINTAHDDLGAWIKMALFIKEQNQKQNKDTKIYVDLAGPKNRTGEFEKNFTPFKIGSKKVEVEVEILPQSHQGALTQENSNTKNNDASATLVVEDDFYLRCRDKWHTIKIMDNQKQKLHVFVLHKDKKRLTIRPNKKISIDAYTTLYSPKEKRLSQLHNLRYEESAVCLFQNDEIILTPHKQIAQKDFVYESKTYAAIVECSNKEIFEYIKLEDSIFIDDGKIGAIVTQKLPIGVVLKITLAKATGTLLKAQKGINFPNTHLDICAITHEDKKNLFGVIDFADLIGISFAQSAKDIEIVQQILDHKGKEHIAIVPKIETKRGVKNLPSILTQLLKRPNYGVMIARGDLAIEVGFDNLPYIQEEIFDICESALVPVIYATQILEGKMKNNLPTRAEVIDAAFAQRADCIMLNKGPFVVDTVIILKKILHSMHLIYEKNRQLLNISTTWSSDNQNERIEI
ncbi:MAG: hypothetical protein KU38_09320 [Sulfurovum sp. FS08-3]|nr:MAG: hypothetical protein KU38_09320 [Sulfurovum sp. FS08-3]